MTTCSKEHTKASHGHMLTQLLQWISEVLHFCQGLPIILVGCKKDLRYDEDTIEKLGNKSLKPVSVEQGEKASVNIGAVRYMECSAKWYQGVRELFEEATRVALTTNIKEKSKKCSILQERKPT